MQWCGCAVVISTFKHSEHAALLRVLSREGGLYSGYARDAASRAKRGIYHPGNIVSLTWKARLSEQLGSFGNAELLTAVPALLMHDATLLHALTSACMLVEMNLAERQPEPQLYDRLEALLHALQEKEGWQSAYIRFELALLSACGYRLDLTACAATGAKDMLKYISPKSGRAVSAAAGDPYRDKLLPLPHGLREGNLGAVDTSAEMLNSLRVTGYFLEKWLLAPHGRPLPAARSRMLEALESAY